MTIQPGPYDPNVPEFPSDDLEGTQPQFLNNFLQLYDIFLKNHVPLDAASGLGNHTIIELKEQNVPLQTDLSEISVYAKDVSDQTDQIFLKYQGNGQEFQYTNYQLYALEEEPTQTKYFTFLPGKILVYFGEFRPTSPSNSFLDLMPYVSRNIITISLCPKFPANLNDSYKPNVDIVAPDAKGYIKNIEIKSSSGFGKTPPPCFYIVMANL